MLKNMVLYLCIRMMNIKINYSNYIYIKIMIFNYILIILLTSILSILTYKYYYNCPNNIIKYKYINDCYDNDNIPSSILFNNLFK
jgi:uncharacterized membrane protein